MTVGLYSRFVLIFYFFFRFIYIPFLEMLWTLSMIVFCLFHPALTYIFIYIYIYIYKYIYVYIYMYIYEYLTNKPKVNGPLF